MSLKICICSIHTPDLQELANITQKNKQEYADRHGYYTEFLVKDTYQGFDKILFLDELTWKNYDWILWTDCDSIITNFTIKIEDIIEKHFPYHFLLTTDVNGINGGLFLFKCSLEGLSYLSYLKERMYELAKYNQFKNGEEQNCMIHTYQEEQWKNVIKIVPQKTFNSYDYDLYGYSREISKDKLGEQGHWSIGDFALHTPGLGGSHSQIRLDVINKYNKLVIK